MATEQGYKYYSKEEIDEKLLDDFVYSTTEKACGKWIDGSTIYKKTFSGTHGNSSFRVNHGISNLDTVVRIEGALKGSFGWAAINRPVIDSTSALTKYSCGLGDVNSTTFLIQVGTEIGSGAWNATLYYTKSA